MIDQTAARRSQPSTESASNGVRSHSEEIESLRAQIAIAKKALENVRAIIAEGAMTGFNCHDGDWAERLFASQATTSAALKEIAS